MREATKREAMEGDKEKGTLLLWEEHCYEGWNSAVDEEAVL